MTTAACPKIAVLEFQNNFPYYEQVFLYNYNPSVRERAAAYGACFGIFAC
jgi:hypothetical protein